jgi:hypothetical protein
MAMNQPVVQAFNQVQRCWLYSPVGISQGFDWEGVRALMALLEIRDQTDITEGLLVMESEFIAIEVEAHEKKRTASGQSD